MTKEEKLQTTSEEVVEEVEVTEASDSEELDSELTLEEALEQIETLTAQKDELYDQYLLAAADVQNARRRAEIDVANAHKFSLEKFVKELLPVIDAMELEMKAVESNGSEELAQFKEGSQLMYKMLLGACEKFGVVQINPLGEKLNPELHQAVTMQPHEGYESNQIITVVQNGYLLNDRLIRAAQVIVAQ